MIAPLVNELNSMQTLFNNQIINQSDDHINFANRCINSISNNSNFNTNQHENLHKNCNQEKKNDKIIHIKTYSIKYHNFNKSKRIGNESSINSIYLPKIVNQKDKIEDPTTIIDKSLFFNPNKLYKCYNHFSYNKTKQIHSNFSKDEDNLLIEIVKKHGAENRSKSFLLCLIEVLSNVEIDILIIWPLALTFLNGKNKKMSF